MISRKIVVIDDDVRVINSVKLVLPELEIVDFKSGEEGLEFLKKPNNVFLVLLDVMMPGIDGINTLHEIKKIRPDIAVVMMTAYGSMDVAVQALRNHADDFIEKPFDIQVLRERVRAHIGKMEISAGDHQSLDKVERIRQYIDRNFTNVSLDSIAKEMSLSTRYVSRMFNHEQGSRFREYKLKVRLQAALDLLKSTSYSVEYISEKVGYLNPESFMRVFKQRYHMTPTQYRKKHREGKHFIKSK